MGVPAPRLFPRVKGGRREGPCFVLFCFLKLVRAGKDGVPFPHSSFFKTLKKFFLYLFHFLQNTISFSSHFFPYSTGVAHPQAGLGSGVRLGVRGLVRESAGQDFKEGSGFEHQENPGGASGRQRQAWPDTHRDTGSARWQAVPKRAGGWDDREGMGVKNE